MSGNLPRHNDKSADQRTELPHSRQRHIRSPEVIKNRGQFPNDAAAVKLLWLAICNIEDKRAAERAKERAQKRCRTAPGRLVEGQVVTNWKKALEQLMLVYPDRIEPYL